MEQSGVVGLTFEGHPERITDFRDAPFCTQLVLVEMLGIDDVTEDTVLDWVETKTIPTAKIGRRRVINLHRIRKDRDRGRQSSASGTTPLSSVLSTQFARLAGATSLLGGV